MCGKRRDTDVSRSSFLDLYKIHKHCRLLVMKEMEQNFDIEPRKLRASDVLGAMAVASGVLSSLFGLDAVANSGMMLDYQSQLEYTFAYAFVSVSGIATSALLARRGK